jgi:cytochrome c oxidase assembly factor CtaG
MTPPSLLVSHWQAAATVDVGALVAASLYGLGVHLARGRWPARRTASFMGGLVCLLVALQSGIDTFAQQTLSVHMVQHMLLLLIVPLLLLGGHPVILLLRALRPSHRRRLLVLLQVARPLTHPLSCLAVFYVVLLATHLPAFYDATLRHPALHDLEHVLYLLAGLLMWWPLVDADPVPAHRLGGLARLAYAIATMPPMALIGAWLDRHQTLVYAAYAAPARSLHISALTDQANAGAIMWVAGNTLMATAGLWVAVSALRAEERRLAARERAGRTVGIAEVSGEGGATA